MTERFCGLDFGTSNSTIGINVGGRAKLCALEDGKATLPSAIFFDYEHGNVRFGRDGIGAYIDGIEGRLLRAIKSVLGSSLIAEKTLVQRRRIAFPEIIGMVLHHLKSLAESQLGQPIESVVLGRPVRFVDNDDAADRRAQQELIDIARKQGFRHVELQLEPVAAALDYETSLDREELAMIVDLGGGTSDFAVMRLSPDRSRRVDRSEDILGRSGIHLGGTDFDRMLSVAYVMPELGLRAKIGPKQLNLPIWIFQDLATWHRIPSLYTSANLTYLRSTRRSADRPELIDRLIDVLVHRNGHRLNSEVEAAKIALSSSDAATIRVPVESPVEVTVTRRQLEASFREGVAKVVRGMDRCLMEADVSRDRIQSVFLTGGSTAIPMVRAGILEHLPHARPVDGDVFGSVGLGLTIDAARRFGAAQVAVKTAN
jgi:hypothetical chaperone protein